ncbi:hypothetical protein BDR05DRAFT_946933 [Suillus weaverae]|nr:hypothetical protein BDR05DRAFT_946933 [Suillus weaverae]
MVALIEHSDPHDAMSVDRLHTVHGSMKGKQLLGELKTILSDVRREALVAVEKFVKEFPQRHGLTHFATVIHIIFTNSNKKQDWLCYLQLDSLIGLDIHTEQTLAILDVKFLVFDATLKDYVEYVMTSSIEELKIDWNFPKIHL